MKRFLFGTLIAGALALIGATAPLWSQTGPQLGPGAVLIDRLSASGGKPTTATCTIADGATNTQGRVTAAGGATSCVITFVASNGQAAAWAFAPVCIVVDETAVRASMTTAVTTTTLTVGAVTTADVFTYFCIGRT